MSSPTSAELQAVASGLGFEACGVAGLEPNRHAAELDRWLASGYAGTMRYLHRQAKKRKQPADIDAAATCAVVVLERYWPGERDQPAARGLRIARYARGRDYHLALRRRLDRLADWLRSRGAAVARPYADAGPVPERELAARAGLGWIGKNAMLIRPGAGSWVFIGSVLTDLQFTAASALEPDRCGSCTRCLDACPTGALAGPRVLDATRCIAYHTIESRAPIPEPLIPSLEGWAFGCDICNEVCPWNARLTAAAAPDYRDREAIDGEDPEFFERMTEEEFAARFADTPLSRPGLQGMRRNWAAARRSRRS